jgi:hypothetical protein
MRYPSHAATCAGSGEELATQPLFYNDATPLTVESLTGLWGDLKATVEALSELLDLPELPLPTVQQMMIFRWVIWQQGVVWYVVCHTQP